MELVLFLANVFGLWVLGRIALYVFWIFLYLPFLLFLETCFFIVSKALRDEAVDRFFDRCREFRKALSYDLTGLGGKSGLFDRKSGYPFIAFVWRILTFFLIPLALGFIIALIGGNHEPIPDAGNPAVAE